MSHKDPLARRLYQSRYYESHAEYKRGYRQAIKIRVLSHYSDGGVPRCEKCGYEDIRALSLDHINGDGKKQVEAAGVWFGTNYYIWLERNGFPDGLQVLCMNCQFIKRAENKEWGGKAR